MGTFLNPGNSGFLKIRNSEYIDKSGLIEQINFCIGTTKNLICVSRPRRFGKSFAAQMLCAYYDKTCDSHSLFSDLKIATSDSYEQYLNQYDVLYVDMASMTGKIKPSEFISSLQMLLVTDIKRSYKINNGEESLDQVLLSVVEETGNEIVMIIDEWDAPIRELPNIEQDYLRFLRMLFKNSGTTARTFAAVYMTGILPIKKDGSQSAISDFEEFTMIDPQDYSEYVGFTETEVQQLCEKHTIDFASVKRWYDGYQAGSASTIYNPNSVMKAIRSGKLRSYWIQTSAADNLLNYISKSYSGMAKTVAELMAGLEVEVETLTFSNDLVTFRSKDDVLTLLIHLGYLTYNEEKGTARIPNEEIRLEFFRAVRQVDNQETIRRLQESDQLFQDTFSGNEAAVAAQIEKVHDEEMAPLHYNWEESLRSVIKLAYYTYKDNYLQWEELPAGTGYADVVYLPKKGSGYPALVVELKWNDSAEGAIQQIMDRNYPAALRDYGGEILLVGVNYDKNAPAGQRKHSCRIIPWKSVS